MKRIYLLLCTFLLATSAIAQTTPWATTTVTSQTRKLSGSDQIRWIWGSSSIFSLPDTLSALLHKKDSTLYQTVSNFFPKADPRYVKLTRQIINGYGMLGGGTLATDRTLNVDTAGVHALVSKDRLATNLTGYLKKTDTGTTALPSIYSLEHLNWDWYGTHTFHNNVYSSSSIGITGVGNFSATSGANTTAVDKNGISIYTSAAGVTTYNRQVFAYSDGTFIKSINFAPIVPLTAAVNILFPDNSGTVLLNNDPTLAGKQDKSPAIGTIYNAATITSTADWANNGLASMTASGGKLIVTGTNTTATDFTASADLTSVGTTNYDKWTITATFTAPTPSATTGIVWFGMRSNNTTASVFNTSPFGIDLSNTGTQGTLYLRGGTGGVFLYATSATKLTIAANDIIKIICTRSLWTYTARIMDITNPQADVKVEYTSTGPLISSMQNAGFFTVFTQTATPISINSFNVYSGDRKNPDVVLFGNSKTMGKAASQYGTSLAGLFGIHFSVLNLGGGGDGTAEVLRLLPSAIAANGKIYILDGIGRNDIAAGVSLATTEANMATIIAAIQATGAQVIVNTGTYETAVNQAPLATYTVTTWPTLAQDTYTATSANLGSVYADGIHATDVSYSIEYQMDRAAITTIGSYDLSAVNNKLSEFSTSLSPLTSSQTANTFLAAPDGSSGLPTFRTIAKGDMRNIFKTEGTGPVADFNDATNNLPGIGPTLLVNSATSGPTGSSFSYIMNIQHIGTAATNNHFQWLLPYGNVTTTPIIFRSYFSSAFGSYKYIIDAALFSGDFTVSNAGVGTLKTSGALAGSWTTTTQAAADNSTNIATTAHVFAERINTATLTNKTLASPTLTGTTTASTVMASTINASGSNIWMPSQTNIISTAVTPAQFAGSTTVFLRAGLGFSTTSSTLTAGASYANTIVGAAPVTLPTTGTTPWLVGVLANGFSTITNSSAIPITNTANFYVPAQATAGTNNYSIYNVGNHGMAGTTSGVITISPQAAAGTYNFNLPTTAGTTGQVLTSAAGGSSPMTWSNVPINQASANLTAQTAAGNITTFTVGANTATFNISAYINVTAVATDVIQAQITYTDENNISQTISFTTISTVTNSTYSPITIRAKNGTAITLKSNLTTGIGSITFDAGGSIIQN